MAAHPNGYRPDRSGPLPLHLDDELRLRKPHPCGADRWRVLRVGADLRLQCLGCGRVILVPRADIERRVAMIFPASPPAGHTAAQPGPAPGAAPRLSAASQVAGSTPAQAASKGRGGSSAAAGPRSPRISLPGRAKPNGAGQG
jgi:hypothetical protein